MTCENAKKHSRLLFGTAGIPLSTKKPDTAAGIHQVRQLGLDCMELEFVHGVKMGEKTAALVRESAEKSDVALSVHGPYYINLNAAEKEKIDASIERIFDSARVGNWCSANNIVFHAAYYLKDDSKIVYDRVFHHLKALSARLKDAGIPAALRPETTGKATQFGDLDELLSLSQSIEGVLPCIDFSHLHARNGKNNTYEEFAAMFEKVENALGKVVLPVLCDGAIAEPGHDADLHGVTGNGQFAIAFVIDAKHEVGRHGQARADIGGFLVAPCSDGVETKFVAIERRDGYDRERREFAGCGHHRKVTARAFVDGWGCGFWHDMLLFVARVLPPAYFSVVRSQHRCFAKREPGAVLAVFPRLGQPLVNWFGSQGLDEAYKMLQTRLKV